MFLFDVNLAQAQQSMSLKNNGSLVSCALCCISIEWCFCYSFTYTYTYTLTLTHSLTHSYIHTHPQLRAQTTFSAQSVCRSNRRAANAGGTTRRSWISTRATTYLQTTFDGSCRCLVRIVVYCRFWLFNMFLPLIVQLYRLCPQRARKPLVLHARIDIQPLVRREVLIYRRLYKRFLRFEEIMFINDEHRRID